MTCPLEGEIVGASGREMSRIKLWTAGTLDPTVVTSEMAVRCSPSITRSVTGTGRSTRPAVRSVAVSVSI